MKRFENLILALAGVVMAMGFLATCAIGPTTQPSPIAQFLQDQVLIGEQVGMSVLVADGKITPAQYQSGLAVLNKAQTDINAGSLTLADVNAIEQTAISDILAIEFPTATLAQRTALHAQLLVKVKAKLAAPKK